MAKYSTTLRGRTYAFADLREVLAKASPLRSGDVLAGVAAESDEERAAAQVVLADVPLATFLEDPAVPYAEDDVTRLILDRHDAAAFAPVSNLSVGEFRDWLLAVRNHTGSFDGAGAGAHAGNGRRGQQDHAQPGPGAGRQKCRVVTRFRNTLGLPGRLAVRLQPNHPTDDPAGIAASILDGLLYGCGDAVIGINPATDSLAAVIDA